MHMRAFPDSGEIPFGAGIPSILYVDTFIESRRISIDMNPDTNHRPESFMIERSIGIYLDVLSLRGSLFDCLRWVNVGRLLGSTETLGLLNLERSDLRGRCACSDFQYFNPRSRSGDLNF